MLTVTEREEIRKQGYFTQHETRLLSIAEGEPFLHDHMLYYFDGRKVLLCGYPLDEDQDILERARCVAQHCFATWPLEVLWYCGPQRISLGGLCPRGIRVRSTTRPVPTDAELVLDCGVEPASRRLRRWLRSQRAKDFEIRQMRGPEISFQAAHLSLIEQFFYEQELTSYLFDLAARIPALVMMEDVVWFEVYRAERLVGLAAIMDSFRDTDLGLFLAVDHSSPGTSDILYASMAEAVLERGKRYLNLGPSASEGQYQFKRKWGAVPAITPFWYQSWGIGELAQREYDSWPARLVRFGVRHGKSKTNTRSAPHNNGGSAGSRPSHQHDLVARLGM
jgi:hypothetical protein